MLLADGCAAHAFGFLFLMQSIQESSCFTSGGKSIALDCYFPANAGRFPAVIALHGSGGNHESMSEPASQLAARGFAVFVVHYFDRTGTTTATDKRTIFGSFPAWGKTVWDAIGHVAKHPHVDAERIGLLGFSLGGYLALSVASVDSRVKVVVEFFGGLPREMKLFMRRLCPVLISTERRTKRFRLVRRTTSRKSCNGAGFPTR
jgi:carboxymethylenebutenolidase